MPMSAICAGAGQAPAAIHGGFQTFNYDQVAHPQHALIGPPPPGAPNGLCLALTMGWLKNWKDVRQPYNTYVTQGPGLANILNHMVAVFAGMGPWPNQASAIMTGPGGGMGFAAVGGPGIANGPTWLGIINNLQGLVNGARYTILVSTMAAGGTHAMGIFKTGQSVYFFDCNQGEAYFKTVAGFAAWFHSYKTPGLGYGAIAGPTLWNLQFN